MLLVKRWRLWWWQSSFRILDGAPFSWLEFYRRNGLVLPGKDTHTPAHYVSHDMNHVISGYEPTGPGEIALGAFTLAMNDNDANWLQFVANLVIHEAGLLKHGAIEPKASTMTRDGATDLVGGPDRSKFSSREANLRWKPLPWLTAFAGYRQIKMSDEIGFARFTYRNDHVYAVVRGTREVRTLLPAAAHARLNSRRAILSMARVPGAARPALCERSHRDGCGS